MTELSKLSTLLAAHSAAESDLETLRLFVSSGGEYRLTVNVEHGNDHIRETVSTLINTLVNMKQFLDVIDRRQQLEVRQAKKAFMDAALSESIADGLKEAAE